MVSLTNPIDPSSVDLASLHYVFSTSQATRDAATYGTSGTTTSANFPTNDNGTLTVFARVIDKDGGFTDYQTNVVINNVNPAAITLNTGSVDEYGTFTLNGSFTDPGAADTHLVTINWGLGESSSTVPPAAGVLTFSATHQYLDDNPSITSSDIYAISVTVTDKDNGSGSELECDRL